MIAGAAVLLAALCCLEASCMQTASSGNQQCVSHQGPALQQALPLALLSAHAVFG